jgi:hypothetical protein
MTVRYEDHSFARETLLKYYVQHENSEYTLASDATPQPKCKGFKQLFKLGWEDGKIPRKYVPCKHDRCERCKDVPVK